MSIHALFLVAALPGAFLQLHADHAEASSFLKSNWNKYEENYHPSYVLDGDPKTAWVEGAEGDGAGESITIPLSTLKTARTVRLEIWNGYQKSKNLLEANAAPARVTIVVMGADGAQSGRLQTTLQRKMGAQTVDIPVTSGVSAVKLIVESVHAGKKYKDTCISDVHVFVDSDVPYNIKAELTKRARLKFWVKERRDTAAYFAKLPQEYPYASARFEVTPPAELARAAHLVEDKDQFLRLLPGFEKVADQLALPFLKPLSPEDRALLTRLIAFSSANDATMPEQGTWMSSSMKSSKAKTPDNLEHLPGVPWLTLSEVGFFEAPGRKGKTEKLYGEMYTEDESQPGERYEAGRVTYSNGYVVKRPDGTIAAMFSTFQSVREERATETYDERQLFVYDVAQHLVAVVTIARSSNDMMIADQPELFGIHRLTWRDGKVVEVTSMGTTDDWEAATGSMLKLQRRTFTAGPTS